MPEPRTGVSVVIVNWNAGDALLACLASVTPEVRRPADVILVDNASSDGSAAEARRRFPDLTLIETGRNLGFAAGANRGAEAAREDVLVFLNPDASLLPGALGTLLAGLETIPGAGIAGGGLLDEAGRWQPGWARFNPVAHLLLDTTLGRLGGRLASRRRRAPYTVDWVYGTFMAVRADLFRVLGGFDTRYFVYGEDLDLCHRAARRGARTIHVADARARHGRNVSAVQRFGSGREAEVVKGEMRFYATRGPASAYLFRTLATCKFGLKTALAAATGRRDAAATYGRVVRACLGLDDTREVAA